MSVLLIWLPVALTVVFTACSVRYAVIAHRARREAEATTMEAVAELAKARRR